MNFFKLCRRSIFVFQAHLAPVLGMLPGRFHPEDSNVSMGPPTPKDVSALLCLPFPFWTSNFECWKLTLKYWEFFHVRSAGPKKEGESLGLQVTNSRMQKDVSCSGSLEFLNMIFLFTEGVLSCLCWWAQESHQLWLSLWRSCHCFHLYHVFSLRSARALFRK